MRTFLSTEIEVAEELYIALKFYKQIPGTVNVDFVFAIIPYLEPLLEVHVQYI